ncbi:hypothetical protein C4564_02330 [Candidatus Microgenomates bacterium]|nr:MAG: hypothetical protein C4564_02330 [Candidatus Microgenomates bacterium]
MTEDLSVDYIKGNSSPDQRRESDRLYVEAMSRVNDRIRELSTKPPEAIQKEQEMIRSGLEDEARKYGTSISVPEVFFVNETDKEKVFDVLEEEFGERPGDSMGLASKNQVIVFLRKDIVEMDTMTVVYHEMQHSVRYVKRAVDGESSGEFISGGGINTFYGDTKGYFFEEGFVLHRTEEYTHNRLSKLYPVEYTTKKQLIPNMQRPDGQPLKHMHESFFTKFPSDEDPGFSAIARDYEAQSLMSSYAAMEERVPGISGLIFEARITGKWGKVARKVDKGYGRGTFQVLMDVGPGTAHVVQNLLNRDGSVKQTLSGARTALNQLKR